MEELNRKIESLEKSKKEKQDKLREEDEQKNK